MGAIDVLKVLEKNKEKKLTSHEIAESTLIILRSVRRVLKSLIKDTSVNLKYRNLSFEEKKERFGHIVNPDVRIYWLEK